MSESVTGEGISFPPFAGQKGAGPARGRSWWGKAWTKAMEDAALDLDPLRRGRRYARTGRVSSITMAPGVIQASVYDADETFYAKVAVTQLTEAEWERFLTEISSRAGHIAALLDRDMPRDLIDSAERAGVSLLPGMGDLEPECSCPDWEFPCLHAAALCYQVAWLLDEDPFLLLLLRGRKEQDLLDQLSARQASAEGAADQNNYAAEDDHEWAAGPAPLPDRLPVPTRPAPALSYTIEEPTTLSIPALESAARAAAVLAHSLLSER